MIKSDTGSVLGTVEETFDSYIANPTGLALAGSAGL